MLDSNNLDAILRTGSESSIRAAVEPLLQLPPDDDNAVFVGIGIALMRAVIGALVEMRDRCGLALDRASLYRGTDLNLIIAMADHGRLSDRAKDALRSYLDDLPGWRSQERGAMMYTHHGYGRHYWWVILCNEEAANAVAAANARANP